MIHLFWDHEPEEYYPGTFSADGSDVERLLELANGEAERERLAADYSDVCKCAEKWNYDKCTDAVVDELCHRTGFQPYVWGDYWHIMHFRKLR